MTSNKQYRGKIISWDDKKSFGFIQFENSNKNIFFHISEFYYSENRPKENYRVTFNIKQVGSKKAAINVTLLGSAPYTHVNVYAKKNSTRNKSANGTKNESAISTRNSIASNTKNKTLNKTRDKVKSPKIALLMLSLLVIAALVYLLIYYPSFFIWIVALSLLNFCRYWYDKAMAQSGGWRTSEASLHLIDVLGGWPGGLLAQNMFNHKISKASFMFVFKLTVIINILAIVVYVVHSKQVIHIPVIDDIIIVLSPIFSLIEELFLAFKNKF